MENNTKKVVMFCANDQAETDHTLDVDGNGEVVLTCACGRFTKLPADTTSESLATYIVAHKASNEGQITVASLEAKKQELLDGLTQDAPADVSTDAPSV